jgi:hypothetical protein
MSKKQTIKIRVGINGDGRRDVPALVFGRWAAHERWNHFTIMGGDPWTVTYVPTGMSLPFYESTPRTVAIETARLLGECNLRCRITGRRAIIGDWYYAVESLLAHVAAGERLPWASGLRFKESP